MVPTKDGFGIEEMTINIDCHFFFFLLLQTQFICVFYFLLFHVKKIILIMKLTHTFNKLFIQTFNLVHINVNLLN
jgi:hypothetical protein